MYPAWINFIPFFGSVAVIALFVLSYELVQGIAKSYREKHAHGNFSDFAVNVR